MHLETDDEENLEEILTVKLQLPRHQHIRLKEITGETMSEIMTEALERYFEDEEIGKEVVM